MFGRDNIKKYNNKIISIGVLVLVLSSWLSKYKYKPNYKILDDEAFASYSNGLIYIGDEDYINSLENVCDGDILIIDERNLEDPNMVICNSCNIRDKDIRNEILEVLCCYEEMYPSRWDRTIESMRLEWFYHNMSYYLNYKVSHSSEVDLNNGDEERYDNKVLSRILRI